MSPCAESLSKAILGHTHSYTILPSCRHILARIVALFWYCGGVTDAIDPTPDPNVSETPAQGGGKTHAPERQNAPEFDPGELAALTGIPRLYGESCEAWLTRAVPALVAECGEMRRLATWACENDAMVAAEVNRRMMEPGHLVFRADGLLGLQVRQ